MKTWTWVLLESFIERRQSPFTGALEMLSLLCKPYQAFLASLNHQALPIPGTEGPWPEAFSSGPLVFGYVQCFKLNNGGAQDCQKVLICILFSPLLSQSLPSVEFLFPFFSLNIMPSCRSDLPAFYALLMTLLTHDLLPRTSFALERGSEEGMFRSSEKNNWKSSRG